MAKGVGGSTAEIELEKIFNKAEQVEPIKKDEFLGRITKAKSLIQENGFAAIYLNAGTNLYYFTGTEWGISERMAGAILFADGSLEYISPGFERGTMQNFMVVEGNINTWEEHKSPHALFGQILKNKGINSGKIGLDETSAFFLTEGLRVTNPAYDFQNAKPVIAQCRMCKSENEIAILQQAKNITLDIIKAAANILYPGISTQEVTDFIQKSHIKSGIPTGSYFCIVLFGKDTQFPHGVPAPNPLKENEIVLI